MIFRGKGSKQVLICNYNYFLLVKIFMEIYQVSETRNNYWSNQSIEKFARLEYRNKSEVFHNELFQGYTGCTWFRPTNHISRQRSLILANIRIDKPSIFVISWMSAVSPSCLRRIYLSRPFFFLIKVERCISCSPYTPTSFLFTTS